MSAGGSTGGSTGESTDVSTNFVWIKLVTAKEDAFAYLEGSSLLVGQVAALACKEYTHWRLNAGQIRLHPVTVSAKEPSEEEIGAAWATGTKPLPVSAAVTSGAWLLAVPTTPDMSTSTTHSSDSILSKLLGLQVAKSEQCRLESEQWRLESTLRYVQVQRWDSHSSSMVKLRASYHVFFVKALAAAWVTSGGARLSMIRDKNWGARQPLTSENYAAFLKQSQVVGAILPDIYVFEQMTQTTLPGQPAGHEQEVGVVGKHLKGVHGGASRSRSSSIHVEFRSAVSLRDGSVCVLCRGEPPLEAAYIISRLAERPELSTALLLTPFVPNNGIMLCIPCHHLHDAFMWCFDPSKGVVVADALLNDEELGPIWRDRIGVQLSQPHAADTTKAAWWPPASVWAAAMARFEVDKAERHAEEDSSPFACGVCLKRFNLSTSNPVERWSDAEIKDLYECVEPQTFIRGDGKVCVHWGAVGLAMEAKGHHRSAAGLAAHFRQDYGVPPPPHSDTHPRYTSDEDLTLLHCLEAHLFTTTTGKPRVEWAQVEKEYNEKCPHRTLLGLKSHTAKLAHEAGGLVPLTESIST